MYLDDDKKTLLSRRTFLLAGLKTSLFALVVGRLYHLQILSTPHYRALSDKNRLHARLIAPLRGQILDCQGHLLATNQPMYRALLIRDHSKNWQESLETVGNILHLSPSEKASLAKTIRDTSRFCPVPLREPLSFEEVAKLEVKLSEISGVILEEGFHRFYPHSPATVHVIGYIGAPSPSEMKNSPLFYLPGFKVGKSGIEKTFDSVLRGSPGHLQVEINSVGKVVREVSLTDPISPPPLSLSLDLELQEKILPLLSEHERSSAVVLNVQTGEIVSYVSLPGFDGNLFVQGISQTQWTELSSQPNRPFLNRPISAQYAPGSLFKMVVALAGLSSQVITPQTSVLCTGSLELNGHKFHCWCKGGHGSVSLVSALAGSCDVYFYHIAALIGVDTITAMAQTLGLGEETGLGIGPEKKGLLPSRGWKRLMFGKGWSLGETYNTGIGQGYLLATPLQLTVMTARLATGRRVLPTLIAPSSVSFDLLPIDPSFLPLIHQGMIEAVNHPRGTAYSARLPASFPPMAGKTATTQVRRITKKERMAGKTNTSSWKIEHRDHAFFVGFYPATRPHFAVGVFIEHGISGGKVAAPIARDIMKILSQKLSKEDVKEN